MASYGHNPAGVDPNVPLEQQYPPPSGPPPAYQAHTPTPTNNAPPKAPYQAHQPPQFAPPPGQANVNNSPNNDLYAPPMPPRPVQSQSQTYGLPPLHSAASYNDDDPSNPVHYTRDPHRLIGYLVPFPKPHLPGVDPATIPARFLIYTPPPPPLQAPSEGEKEARIHKLQRKWQSEVRQAKQSDAKLASWKGLKSRATKGISWAMGAVKSADLEFLNRVPNAQVEKSPRASMEDRHTEDGKEGSDKRTVGLEALDLVYPPSLSAGMPGGEQELRKEFIESMMRTKSKAQRDAVLATGLLPVSAAVDLLATLIWPFGGLLEVDAVWAYASIQGAKTSRSVTKRLASSTQSGNLDHEHGESKEQLQLHFLPSSRLEVLRQYLAARCAEKDPKLFPVRDTNTTPTEASVIGAIGWAPSQTGGENRNWEDEQWETEEVKDDLKMVMSKAARSWDKWCKAFAKDPEKALKK